MTEQFINQPSTLFLASPCSSSDTALSLGGGFSVLSLLGTYRLLIDPGLGSLAEIVQVQSRSGAAVTVVRGQEGTTAQSHLVNAQVEVSLTAAAMAQLIQDLRGGTTFELAYGGTTSYDVLLSDRLVVFDASGWTNQGALEAVLPASPEDGEAHSFYWDGWVGGAPPPLVSGNGNPIAPYSQNVQSSKARAPGNLAAITDNGAVFRVMWSQVVGAWLPW
jgi:hypothetical protein